MNQILIILVVSVVCVALYIWRSQVSQKNEARQNIYKEIREQQPAFFKSVSDLMFEHDPIEINFETNTDEYDPEAGTVIYRLPTANNEDDVLDILHQEFVVWFGEDTAGNRNRYAGLASDIWKIWREKA